MSAIATIDLGRIRFKWRGAYNGATTYKIDDVVSHQGSTFVCVGNSAGNVPFVGSAFWEIMALGADIANTMTTQGDLLVRGSTALQRLGVGASGQPLEVVNGMPAWGTKGYKLINKVNSTYQGGIWYLPHGYTWATGLYQNYTPQRTDTQITFRAFFSTASSDTGSIHQGRFIVDGVYSENQYTFNLSGHAHYAGESHHVEFTIPSWTGGSRTIGLQMGKHSAGYGIYLHAASYGNPNDVNGAASPAGNTRAAFYTIEEWLPA